MESECNASFKEVFIDSNDNLAEMLLTEPLELEKGLNYVHERTYLNQLSFKPWLKGSYACNNY